METVTVNAGYAVDADSTAVYPPYPFGGVHSCDEYGLDAAIATGGGPHIFDCGGSATITTSDTKTITSSTTIDGSDELTISGGGTHGVFHVASGTYLELHNITIADGDAAQGGGILVEGDTVIIDSVIEGNTAANQGGGIYVRTRGAERVRV